MIELAAKAWGLGIPATVAKLTSQGAALPDDKEVIRNYVQDQLKYRRRISHMWTQARAGRFHDSASVSRVAQTLHLNSEAPRDRWLAGPGQMVGALSRLEVEEALRPTSINKGKIFRENNKLRWEDVLAVPLYDLPGRPCAFLFAGRKARPDKDFIFYMLNVATNRGGFGEGGSRKWDREAGVSMHPDVLTTSTEWHNQIIAVADPFAGLHLHSRHCEHSTRQLPLVSWYCTEQAQPARSWKMFVDKKMVFWAPELTKHVIHQAIVTGGWISTLGPDAGNELQQYMWKYRPQDLMEKIIESAAPWDEVVAKHLSKLANNEIEDLLLQLQLDGMDVSLIQQRSPGMLRSRLDTILSGKTVGRTIFMGDRTVIEREGGWYIEGRRPGQFEQIMDAQLRIDAVVNQPRLSKSYYMGHIIFAGESVEFCVPVATLDRKPFEYLRQLLFDHEVGSLTFNPSWNVKLVNIAMRFQKPKFISGLDTVGWDGRSFVLPKYSVQTGGEIVVNKQDLFPADSPAINLPLPEAMSGQELEALFSDDATTSILWSVLSTIGANILAPAYRQNPSGIALSGPGVEELTHQVAKLCGCLSVRAVSRQHGAEHMLDQETRHKWPIIMQDVRKGAVLAKWLDPSRDWDRTHNCLVRLPWYVTTARKLLPGWHVIEDMRSVHRLSDEACASVRKFFPALLLDLCQKQLPEIDSEDTWLESVLVMMSKFVTEHGGPGDKVLKALASILPQRIEGHAEAFVDLVYNLIRDGDLVTLPEGFTDAKRPVVIQCDEGRGFAVPKEALADILAKKHMRLTDFSYVTNVLRSADALEEDSNKHWIVKPGWWQAQVNRLSNDATGSLKVYGV